MVDENIAISSSGFRGLAALYCDLLDRLGFAEVLGGRAVLEQGIGELVRGALPIAAELIALESKGVDLADAVNDPEAAPHTCRLHGMLEDLLTMDVPAELLPLVTKIMHMAPLADVRIISGVVARLALADSNPMARALGRLMVFESACLAQRLVLLASGVQIEALGGRKRDVEVIAERELELAEADETYRNALLQVEDPLAVIGAAGIVNVDEHLQILKRELASLTRDFHEVVERRRQILEAADQLDAADAVLLLNQTAAEFGEERLTAEQLRRRHPGHFGPTSEVAIYKRVERLPDKLLSGSGRGSSAGTSLGDLIVASARERA